MNRERSDFEYYLDGRPDFGFLTVQLSEGQTIKAEASSMATMDRHVQMKTKMSGGLGRLMTGESVFINEFTAEGGPGAIQIAPGPTGDLDHVYLEGEDDVVFLENAAYVASSSTVEIASQWQGFMKGFFSGAGLFLIRCSGPGDLWFNTYGALIEKEVDGEYVVDTSHVVAFTGGLEYNVESIGGYKSLFFSGEGLVCRFHGRGRVWIQTRKVPALATWVDPFRREKSDNNS